MHVGSLKSSSVIRYPFAAFVAQAQMLPARLHGLPPRTHIVTGQLCAALELAEQLARADPAYWGRQPTWPRDCAGWAWPSHIEAVLDQKLRDGWVVVVDLRPGAWVGSRQRDAFEQAAAYVEARVDEVEGGRIIVWR